MAAGPSQPLFLDLRTQAIEQQRLRKDAWHPSSVSSRKGDACEKSGFVSGICAPVREGGTAQCETRAAAIEVICVQEGLTEKERQEFLWQDFFLDPALWHDNRQDKKSSRHPDFRHKRTKEPLWLDNRFKPAWVDSQLVALDAQLPGSRNGDSEVANRSRPCEERGLAEAVHGLDLMLQGGYQVDISTLYSVLKRCIAENDLVLGKRIHVLAVKSGYESSTFLANNIIRMYASHGKLEEARQVFTKVPVPDTFMWESIIKAHSENGQPEHAVELYRQMRKSRLEPNNYIFVAVLKACATAVDLAAGKAVHDDFLRSAVDSGDVFVGSCLVDMYAKCGSLKDARRVFDNLPTRDVVTWTAMIAGYSKHGLGQEALTLYASMEEQGMTPANSVTFVCLLQACASVGALHQGRQLHIQIQKRRLEDDVIVGSCLVDMYAKCGSLVDARRLFDKLPSKDVVTWNCMIAGYAQHGLGQEALSLYARMQHEFRIPADKVTFVSLLQACAGMGALHQGKQLHAQVQERGLENDVVVGSSLVEMYAKCGSLEDACRVFHRLSKRDVVTWNCMIAAHVENGLNREALSLHANMQHEGVVADSVTYLCLLRACASVAAVQQGKQVHAQIQEKGLEGDLVVGSSLVDMYAKCGSLEDARRVFDRLSSKDVVTWTALLNGYAEHSDSRMAMQCFEEMQQQGVEPDETTFSSLLVACSHDNLVNEGERYFKLMVEEHGISPNVYHYDCMVDLLGRSGRLDEAEDMLRNMPFKNDVVGWTSLLSACKVHGDPDRGRRCFDQLIKLEPDNGTAYALLASIYAGIGRWEDAQEIDSLRKYAGVRKKPAKACIEVNRRVHEFTVGDDRSDISSKVRSVNSRLKEEGGHVPQTGLVLKAGSEEVKEDSLCGHAEKLALAYGLLNTPEGTTLLVTKNLRMCADCHSSTKVMSRLEKRDIIVRDAHRVHRFLDGCCSCGDRN